MVGNSSDADDIVQDAFLRMLRADVPADNEEHLRRYLYRVASNLIVDRWRHRRHERGEDGMPEGVSPPPRYEDDASVAKIFAELTPRDRALLWLAYVEGESHEEAIAAFMSRIADLRIPNPGPRVPDPAQLWCTAKLLAQWDAERRVQRPLDMMQHIEIAGGLVAAGLLLYWSLPCLFL